MRFTQEQFERLSQLMADKGVRHEAFELLADLRMSERNFAEKAQAYDRLMSGGRKTLKEWANFLGKCFAVDPDGFGYSTRRMKMTREHRAWKMLIRRLNYLNSFGGNRSEMEKTTKMVLDIWDDTGHDELPEDPDHQGGGRMNEKCTWSEDEDGLWWTACKEIHEFFDGTPIENGHRFCPYCGKVLVEKMLEYEGEDV